jgi:hypothetical protein
VTITPRSIAAGGHVIMGRCRIELLKVAEDGSIELPDGATIISLEFESEGAYGFGNHPAAAWVVVPVDGAG